MLAAERVEEVTISARRLRVDKSSVEPGLCAVRASR
jgi:hypothetical protein